jgi:hypothetical protein
LTCSFCFRNSSTTSKTLLTPRRPAEASVPPLPGHRRTPFGPRRRVVASLLPTRTPLPHRRHSTSNKRLGTAQPHKHQDAPPSLPGRHRGFIRALHSPNWTHTATHPLSPREPLLAHQSYRGHDRPLRRRPVVRDAELLGWWCLRCCDHQLRAHAAAVTDHHLRRAVLLEHARRLEPASQLPRFNLGMRLDFIKYCIPNWACWISYNGLDVRDIGPYASADNSIISQLEPDQVCLDHILHCRTWREAWETVRHQIGPDFDQEWLQRLWHSAV